MEPTTTELVALAGAGAVLVLLLLLWLLSWRSRRHLRRRLAAVSTRLEAGVGEILGKGGTESALARLERAADTAALERSAAIEAAERHAAAMRHLGVGVVVADADGEIVFRNDAADVLDDETIESLLNDGEHREQETLEVFGPPTPQRRRAETWRTIQVTTVQLDDGARTIGSVLVVEDVSERRRLAGLQREFVANLVARLEGPLRGSRVAEDLAALARADAEHAPVREPVSVHVAIGEARQRIRATAEAAGVVIEVGEAPREVALAGDRRQLVGALVHLLDNAIASSDRGETVQVGSWTDGEWVEIAVRDQGTGIPPAEVDRIFERFYRIDRDGMPEGSGIGLSIVRQVAHAHGGEVRVTSTVGEGSTFTMRVPALPAVVGRRARTRHERGPEAPLARDAG